MEAMEAILTRKSVRDFLDKPVEEEKIRTILQAGMGGPCCVNARDWQFLVVRDKETLNKMADVNGRPATPLRGAAFGILILGDFEKAYRGGKEYWIIDGAIAGENMSLAAHALGLGSVWLGTYPEMDRVHGQIKLFDLPAGMIPHSIIAFGYPAKDENYEVRDLYEEEKVHFEKW